MRLENQT